MRLRKYTEVLKRTLQSKSDELDQKKSLINQMIERSLGCSSDKAMPGELYTSAGEAEGGAVEDLDIDSLLQANLGAVNITDILNISESDNNFLPDLSMLEEPEAESEKVHRMNPVKLKILLKFIFRIPLQLELRAPVWTPRYQETSLRRKLSCKYWQTRTPSRTKYHH